MTRVLHIVNGLDPGGAETMLSRLLTSVDRRAFEPSVVSLTTVGPIGDQLRARDIPVAALEMSRGSLAVPFVDLRRLRRAMDAFDPDVLHTWMYHSNLIGGLANRLGRARPLVWSIRQTNIDAESIGWRSALVARCGAACSYVMPDLILYNATVSRRRHEAAGYRAGIGSVVPNGFDTDALKPNADDRTSVRDELGVDADTPVVGMVARFDPQKDHMTFIAAASLVARQQPEVRFVLVGKDVDDRNTVLTQAIAEGGLSGRVHCLGQRDDVPRLMSAMDVVCLTSTGEGFPNALGEAMAAAVPCVATDVGDCAFLVGETGTVVPPRRPDETAKALCRILSMNAAARTELGRLARRRIVDRFGIQAIATQFADIWRDQAASTTKR